MNINHYLVSHQLHRAEHVMGKAFTEALRELGVTPAQVGVLLHINRFPGITMAKVAEIALITPQTMHRIVTGLERRKLVNRKRKDGDRKSFYLSLTPAGKEVLGKAEVVLKAEQDILLRAFSAPELEHLYSLLQRFEAVFSKIDGDGRA